MRANNSARKLNLSNMLEEMDVEVTEVYASVTEESMRDQQINMMMLSRLAQVCADDPQKAVQKYNLPPDVVEMIAASGHEFYLKIQPLTDKCMFDMSRNADTIRRALNSENELQSAFSQIARFYSTDIKAG